MPRQKPRQTRFPFAPAKPVRLTVLLVLLLLRGSEAPVEHISINLPPGTGSPADQGPIEGYLLYDLGSRTVLEARAANQPFIPASLVKIPATITALELLGPQWRFSTTVRFSGTRDGERFNGDLCLKGDGDPFLNLQDLMGMVERLSRSGLRELSGRFLYDETALAAGDRIDEETELDESYNPGFGPLALQLNAFYAEWRPFRSRAALERFLEQMPEPPPAPAEPLTNRSAGLFAARVFRLLCGMQGISLPPPEPGGLASGTTLVVHRSRPLADLVELSLAYSNNQMVEMLLLAAMRRLTGRILTPEEAGRVMLAWFAERLPGIDWSGSLARNASGLSTASRMTAVQVVATLLFAERRRYAGRSYPTFLPVSGWTGTMAGRLQNPEMMLRVWAKSGTLYYATSLAGFLHTRRGRRLAFAVYRTDPAARRLYDAQPRDKRSPSEEKKAIEWLKENRDAVNTRLEEWAARY